MATGFRRYCTTCKRTVSWRETPKDDDGEFYHVDDESLLCAGGSVDLEVKEI